MNNLKFVDVKGVKRFVTCTQNLFNYYRNRSVPSVREAKQLILQQGGKLVGLRQK